MKHKTELLAGAEYLQEFGLGLSRTSIDSLSAKAWSKLRIPATGKYIPHRQIAIYNQDAPGAISTLFHEAFGHGIVCEHTKMGRKLVQSGNSLDTILKEESEEGIYPINFHNFEGFATWLEATLCEETDNLASWKEKERLLDKPKTQYYLQLREGFLQAEEQLSRFGVFAQMGFPKHYTNEIVVDTLRAIYGDQFRHIQAAMLYGSQKPESDIDLFVIANERAEYNNGWLDISQRTIEDTTLKCSNLDICVTDPLFSGTTIYGDERLVGELKTRAQKTPPQDCVTYNKQRERIAQQRAKQYEGIGRERCLDYAQSYRTMSCLLEQGISPLTREQMLDPSILN